MPTPFSHDAFFVTSKTLHFFGPAAKFAADSFIEQAMQEGWASVEWAGCSVPFPTLPSRKKTVVRVSIHGTTADFCLWNFRLPEIAPRLRKSPVLLVGVSEDDTIPRAWKFYAHARFRADEGRRLVVVKDKVTYKHQAFTYVLGDDGVWVTKPEPDVESDLDDHVLTGTQA